MATELKVPVRLEVLQDSIANIKSTLANLRPESGAWKDLQNILRAMVKEADNLQAAMSRPFSAQKDFTSAEKGIGKIEDALERARIIMSRISFSDLKLDASQSVALKEFERQLQEIEDKARNFKAVLKAELQDSANWGDVLALDPNAITQSYDEIVKSIQTKVKQIEAESKKAAEALRIATEESNRATASKQFFNAEHSLSTEGMGEAWSSFFQNNKNGELQFRSGKKSAFYEWMRDNLTITPAQYEEIKNKTITELQKWIKEFDVNKVINDEAKKIQTKNEATTRVANALADAKKAEAIQQVIANNQEKIAANDRQLQSEKNIVTTNWSNYTAQAENAARASLTASSGMREASAQCSVLSNALQRANTSWMTMDRAANTMNGIRNAIVNFMGFHQILNLTRNAVRQAAQHIQELDTVMSKIAIVTDMSTGDLWNQVDAYSNMAQTYGVSIKGAYEVSQIYYQQGLETADVLTLTNETLKLAKISGLDYATTTDYMTTALRGFKMEMQEAGAVVDVYSALAAHTAVSQEELAVAMSKTASSMESVGSTFEETSAMIGTMVAVTRESATNIGSAMKSIASRYGELTKDPTTLLDAEGEAMSFNKVDAALQSVGISMKTVDGQFREFTDVIVELGERWNELDSTQQRYIATQFAGNRQQSRFLALVSNVDLLKSNMDVAMNSEDTGTLQALKALDSIESKTEQVKVAYQQFYTTLGAENVWKSALDGLKEYINMLNGLPKLFGKIPVGAVAMIANLVDLIRFAGTSIVSGIADIWQRILPNNVKVNLTTKDILPDGKAAAEQSGKDIGSGLSHGIESGISQAKQSGQTLGENAVEGVRQGAGTHSDSIPATQSGNDIYSGLSHGMEAGIEAVKNAGRSLGESAVAGVKEGIQNIQSVAALLVSQLSTLAPEIQSKFGSLNDFTIENIRNFIERPEWNDTKRAMAYTGVDIQRSTLEASNLANDIKAINDKIAAYEILKQKQLEVNSITDKKSEEYKKASSERSAMAKELGTSWNVNSQAKIDELTQQKEQLTAQLQERLGAVQLALNFQLAGTEQLQEQLSALGFEIKVKPVIDSPAASQAVKEVREKTEGAKATSSALVIPTSSSSYTPHEDSLPKADSQPSLFPTGTQQNQVDLINKQIDALFKLRDAKIAVENAGNNSNEKSTVIENYKQQIEEIKSIINTDMFTKGLNWTTSTDEIDAVIAQYQERLSNFVIKPTIELEAGAEQLGFNLTLLGVPQVQLDESAKEEAVEQTKAEIQEAAKSEQIEMDFEPDYSRYEQMQLAQELQDFEEDRIATAQRYHEEQRKIKEELLKQKDIEERAARSKQVNAVSEAAANKLDFGKLDNGIINSEQQQQSAIRTTIDTIKEKIQAMQNPALSHSLAGIGSAISTVASALDKSSTGGRVFAGVMTTVGGTIKVVSALMNKNPWMALATGVLTIINGISIAIEDDAERLERLTKEAEEASNEAKKVKANLNILETGKTKLEELEKKRYDSAEAAEEYQSKVDELASSFPQLISGFDEAGNAIIETSNMEDILTAAREQSAAATLAAARAEKQKSEEERKNSRKELKEKVSQADTAFRSAQSGLITERANDIPALKRADYAFNPGENEALTKALGVFLGNELAPYRMGEAGSTLENFEADLLVGYQQYAQYKQITQSKTENEGNKKAAQTVLDNLKNAGLQFELLEAAYNAVLSSGEELSSENFTTAYTKVLNATSELSIAEEQMKLFLNDNIDLTTGFSALKDETDLQPIIESIEKLNTAIEQDDIEGIKTYYAAAAKAVQGIDPDYMKSHAESYHTLFTIWTDVANAAGDYIEKSIQDNANAIEVVSGIVRGRGQGRDFITDKSGLAGLISGVYGRRWQAGYKAHQGSYSEETFNTEEGTNLGQAIEASDQFWTDLVASGTEKKDKFVKMLSDISKYRESDFTQFSDITDEESWNQVYDLIKESIAERVKGIQDSLTNFYTKNRVHSYKSNIQDANYDWSQAALTAETAEESQYLKDVYLQFAQLNQAGLSNQADNYMTAALAIYNSLPGLEDDLRLSIWQSIEKNGLKTKEQIEKIRQSVLNNDNPDDDYLAGLLNDLSATMNDNIILAVQTASSDFVESWSDDSKTMKKLTSGLDISEVEGLINSEAGKAAGLSMDSFISDGEKLILKASEVDNYITKYFEVQQGIYDNRYDELSTAATQLGITSKGVTLNRLNGKKLGEVSEEDLTAIEAILGSKDAIENYLNENKEIDAKKLSEALLKAYKNGNTALANYQAYIDWASAQVETSRQWAEGNYASLGEHGIGNQKVLQYSQLKYRDQLLEQAKDNPDLLNAASQVQSGASSLISDALSKGLNNLSALDYKSLPLELDFSGTYTDFLNRYVRYTGKTIDEINALYAQALEKDQEQVASSLIKDFTFTSTDTFMASTDALRNLADAYDIALETLIANAGLKFNEATEQYFGTISGLEFAGVNNIRNIHNFNQIVADSITDYIGSIDVSKFLNAASSTERTQEGTKLAKNIQTYLDATNKVIYQPISEDLQAQIDSIRTRRQDLTRKFVHDEVSFAKWDSQWTRLYREEKDILSQIGELSIEDILDILNNGGEKAVDLLKQLKGENVTTSELEAAFNNSQIAKLRTAAGELTKGVGETVTGYTKNIMQAAGFGLAELDDGTAVITSVGDMVQAYINLYAKMEEDTTHTTGDLNSIYAKLITQYAQSSNDLKDLLSNAATGISADTFGTIMEHYGLVMKEVLESANGIAIDQFGNIIIQDFKAFESWMNENANTEWNSNDPAFKSLYNSYIDSKVEILNRPITDAQTAAEQLNNILNAKKGEAVNISYLDEFNKADEETKEAFEAILQKYGAVYQDGILTLSSEAQIPNLVGEIGQLAQKAGVIIPEQLAQLEDAIVGLLDNIVSLLSNGVSGSLSHENALTLSNWYKDTLAQREDYADFIKELDFSDTADGLQLTETSLANIYELLKGINAEKADAFLENIISSKESYQTLTGALREFNDSTNVTNTAARFSRAGYNGTVDVNYNSRPHIINADGTVSTVSALSSGNGEVEVLVTPILPDGSRLSEDSADKYASMFANKEIDLTTKLVGEDGQELEYSFKDIYMGTYDTVEAANEVAESLHEWHEAISKANTELSKTSSMMQDIVQKAMVNPDSMNFMSNKLPDDIQTAVNAWENAAKAISTLTTAQKNGYMGVQDFYNIVTTASSLMEAAGKSFEVAGMNAGELMLKGAENVKIVDGQLTVDLSSAGMNIVGDVDSLKENMKDGVQELAKAEIAMIDAEIQVLEILAAMEQLGDMDVDVDNNGINFEVDDIFDVKGPKGFSDKMADYTKALLDMCKTNEKLESALQQVKINNKTLYDLLQADANTWIETFGSKENVSKFWQNFSEGIEGWDVEGNLQEQVLNFFKGLNSELTVDLGDSGVFHIGVNGAVWSIDFTNEQLMQDAEAAAKKFDLLHTGEDIKNKIKEILAKQQTEGTLDLGETFTLHVASGTITLVTDDNETKYKVGNNTYSDAQLASAVADLTKIGATITDDIDLSKDPKFSSLTNGKLNGKLKIGSFEVDVESAGEGVTYKKDGYTANSLDDLYAKLYLQDKNAVQDSITDVLEYKKWQVKQGILVETIFEVDGQESDPNKNKNLRKAIQDYLTGNNPITNKNISIGENGSTVTLEEGITLTIPENKVQLNFEEDGSLTQKSTEQLQSYLREITGVDLGLKDTISQAITDAFTDISSQLTLLNTTEPTGLNSWSSAIAAIGTAAETAATAVQTLIDLLASFKGGGSSGPTINVPEGLTVPTELDTPDTSSVVAMEHELAGGVKVKIPAEFDESTVRSSAAKVLDGANDEMSTDWNTMDVNTQNATGSITEHFTTMTREITAALQQVTQAIDAIKQHVSITWTITVKNPELGETNIEETGGDIREQKPIIKQVTTKTDTTEVSESVAEADATANVNTSTNPNEVVETITALTLPTISVPVQGKYIGTLGLPSKFQAILGAGKATGNFGPADARGTLMGELGPELVVQDGRYFVAGQNGAEFVNLQDDAIVFNHLQTEQLLKKGMSSTRGRAVTNERTAVAFAQGNVNGGPAMASASAALAALKRLRSMWESLASASVQDLAGAGGGGGGGGGGDKDMAAYIKELEKWYNWLQKIAELEDKINYQEQLRSTISSSQRKNGSAYYSSLKDTLKNLQEQVKTEQSLIDAQQKYFDKRRKELNTNGPFNSLYTFDENGQLKYKKGALNKLSKLNETDKYGKPKMSSEQQYDYIVNTLGIDEQYLQTTASGEKIDKEQEGWQATAVQAFWDKMDADKEEMQSLHDSINEHSEALLAAQEQQNEILQEMRDNQLAVEKNVYDAIVDSRERAIEDAEAMRDALEESTTKFIDGLSSALDKERSMYEMQQSQTDLDQKRRRLAILQRTGGSNSEIASLQSDIASSERDLYFDKQQEQIDLIQEASDKQIEKLDQQIELDKELLEYQKAHGLLWSEVADIMKMDSAAITDFITSNNSEWWAKSPVQSAQDLQDAIFQTDQWVEFRDDQNSFFQNIIDTIYNTTTNAAPDNPTSTADSTTQLDNNGNGSNNTRVKYKSLNEKKHKKITQKKNKKGKWETTKEQKEDHDFDSKGKCTKCGYKKKKDSGNGTGGSGNSGNGSGSSNGAGGNGGEQAEPISTKFKYEQYSQTQHYKIPIHSDGTTGAKIAEAHSFSGTTCTKCFYSKYQEPQNRSATTVQEQFKNNDNNKQIENIKSSSLSDINLTQDEIQKLRTSTLSNGLSAVNSAMKMNLAAINSSAYTTIDREKSTQIGSISLNMDVKQIANDYDAKRAGEKAMEEMLRIARKSTTATVRR